MAQPTGINLHDIREALGALTGDPYIAAEIDGAFIEMFTRNMEHFDKLPSTTREEIRKQWAAMALEKSYRSSVAQKASEDKSRAMADWFKGLNLLLAQHKVESSITPLP